MLVPVVVPLLTPTTGCREVYQEPHKQDWQLEHTLLQLRMETAVREQQQLPLLNRLALFLCLYQALHQQHAQEQQELQQPRVRVERALSPTIGCREAFPEQPLATRQRERIPLLLRMGMDVLQQQQQRSLKRQALLWLLFPEQHLLLADQTMDRLQPPQPVELVQLLIPGCREV